jgi:hypothetical protein
MPKTTSAVKPDGRRTDGPKRDKLLGVLLTQDEWKACDDRAAAEGLTASSWARLRLLEDVKGNDNGDR